MITWADILDSLKSVDPNRLSDPAVVEIDCELVPIDLIESTINEINDNRLIAYRIEDI